MPWQINAYHSSADHIPVFEFIETLDQSTQQKISRLIDYLENNGPYVHMPHSKQLESNLYELRIKGKQEVRIFCCFVNQTIYLLHGMIKKTNKTPKNDLVIAKERMKMLK